jgi:DNA-binding GntR family transcriptional regulator
MIEIAVESEDGRWARGKLVDDLSARMQSDILTGEYPIGSWLRQSSLASHYGVSRTPVREALRKLQALGLVELRPNAGAIVRGPTARDIRESYQVRAHLEGLAAELAAPWITERQLDQLRATEDLFADAIVAVRQGTPEGRATAEEQWRTANDVFHEVIHEATGNHRLQATIRDLHRHFPRQLTWGSLREDARLLEENHREHQTIREALNERAPEEARRLMIAHVLRAGELVTRWFERSALDLERR